MIIFFNEDQTVVDIERKAKKKTNIVPLAVNSLNIYHDCARCAHDYARISIKNSWSAAQYICLYNSNVETFYVFSVLVSSRDSSRWHSFHKWIFRCENYIIRRKINLDICFFFLSSCRSYSVDIVENDECVFRIYSRLFPRTVVTKGCSDKPTKGRARGGFLGEA